jgi:hypothetical protein
MRGIMVLALVWAASGPLAAQGRPAAERVREQVVQRFMENYRYQAGLTDEQYTRFQAEMRRSWDDRRVLQERERELLRGLERQLRPGVAGQPDSVTRLVDGLLEIQAERVALARGEQARFAEFLTPVQRGQLVLAITRLENLIDQAQRGPGMPRRPR